MKAKDVNNLINEQNLALEKLHKIVSDAIEAEELIIQKITHPPIEKITYSQKISDSVALFGGSWKFIIYFFVSLSLWIIYNIFAKENYRIDPYPFIFLNLILSTVAALQAPLILMSQNRQEEKDRKQSENDYLINLKAEMQIRSLNQKVDLILEDQIKTLFISQEKQIELLNQIDFKISELENRNKL